MPALGRLYLGELPDLDAVLLLIASMVARYENPAERVVCAASRGSMLRTTNNKNEHCLGGKMKTLKLIGAAHVLCGALGSLVLLMPLSALALDGDDTMPWPDAATTDEGEKDDAPLADLGETTVPARKDGEKNQPWTLPEPAERKRPRRVGAADYARIGMRTYSNKDAYGYTLDQDPAFTLGASYHFNEYFSGQVSLLQGKGSISYDTERTVNLGALQYTLSDVSGALDRENYSVGLTWEVFGKAESTPFLRVSRQLENTERSFVQRDALYSFFSSTPLSVQTTKSNTDDLRRYITSWFAGYEHAANSFFSVSGGFYHNLSHGMNDRGMEAEVNMWASKNIALGLGAGRGYDSEITSFFGNLYVTF